MATRTFRLESVVAATPIEAVDFLSRLDLHRGLHPYFQRAEVTAEGVGEAGTWSDWRVVERTPLGPLRYTLHFTARLTRTSPTSLHTFVEPAPRCTLTATTTASRTDGGTRLVEMLEVAAPRPLIGYMSRHAELAHARTFRSLAGVWGSSGNGPHVTPDEAVVAPEPRP
jgi:hypothetical protein